MATGIIVVLFGLSLVLNVILIYFFVVAFFMLVAYKLYIRNKGIRDLTNDEITWFIKNFDSETLKQIKWD